MKEVYMIGGLTTDERIFERLTIKDSNIRYINWIIPVKGETIEKYAGRMAEKIITRKPILIGLSFGGMICVEIAKQIDTEKVILISSAKSKKEIPPYFRLAGALKINKLIPWAFAKQTMGIAYHLLGAKTNAERTLLKSFINKTDTAYLKWAINNIVKWRNETEIKNLVHIHGSADATLPLRYVKATRIINKGGHMMVMNRAAEVSAAINEYLK